MKLLVPCTLALLLAGCGSAMQTRYQRPDVDLPAQWHAPSRSGAQLAAGEAWWQRFGDPALDALIARALRSNNDLAVAAIKVRRARLQAGLTDTNLMPTLGVSGNASVSKDLKSGGPSTRSYGVTATLGYEVDLWGKLARQRDAAAWEATATEQDRRAAALSLIGTTAQLYWQLGYLNQRIANGEASIAYSEKTLQLVQVQHRAGAASGLDELQAAQSLASQQASLIALRQQRDEARNALAILFDQAPGATTAEPARLPTATLPEVPAGIPADVLAHRPDLQAAEWRLRASLANVDATRASFYPTFSLTGSVGSSSTTLRDVLSNPIGTLGAGLTLPFLQWNTTQLTIQTSQADYEAAVIGFRQSLYKALAEVENALSARNHDREEGEALQRSLDLATRAEKLAEVRYRAGKTGVKEWLDQQEARRSAENALAENRYRQLNGVMTVYRVLGGAAS
ncbi:efflux transporter, outer membrane factor (OMF) lipoprotein, NodT family [Andreprevotia lacus DSM 23236]|uniref:Efflux transporter, outer membrane factor (OMF) lipoprotein, NodT family n=1 Tax=Andreprevotia lacus DSM 23236 TaxID=1121001 RepID=A0A1W1XVT2_9NEIS|nr:efflux transporter outer membrane subunit [Andreprevotia lacus]SMC27962.1 efflux transporter, outer membrane factor (OMF) lipoprotein, NodT family [Andreprevotia lacus DSM 23236]